MSGILRELSLMLAANAEAVCRRYLTSGRRSGGYWVAGDVRNAPGRSLWVRLTGPVHGPGAAGRWADEATGEHGDLVDLIRSNQRLDSTGALIDEIRQFLALGHPDDASSRASAREASFEHAARLWRRAHPVEGTPAECYLRARGITMPVPPSALRCLPECAYRPDLDDPPDTRRAWPALVAAVRDDDGELIGIQRTWLDPGGRGKAPVSSPRRSLGRLRGGGVRIGRPGPVIAIGEGIETVLSLREIMPNLPVIAALSATQLVGFAFTAGTRRVYAIRDNDPAGTRAVLTITARAETTGVDVRPIVPRLGDLNDDLRSFGRKALIASLLEQLDGADVSQLSA